MKVEMFDVKYTCARCGKSFSQQVRKEVVEGEEVRTCFTCMAPMIQGEAEFACSLDTETEDTSGECKGGSEIRAYEVWLPLRQTRILEPCEVEIAEVIFGHNMVVSSKTISIEPGKVKPLEVGEKPQLEVTKDRVTLLSEKESEPFSNKQKEEELDERILALYNGEAK